MDSLCEHMEYTNIHNKLSYHFIKDLNTIIESVKNNNNCNNMIEICLKCNNQLHWNDNDKYISILEYNWLISHGRFYFLNQLSDSSESNKNINLFNELIELFKLQLE